MKFVDMGYQFSYWILYRLASVWFWLFRCKLNGVFVVIWHDARFLAVRTSYKTEWTVPGGMRNRDEDWDAAGVREAFEEVGVTIDVDDLAFCGDVQGGMGRNDNAKIFECILAENPEVIVDNREIVEARFVTPAEALRLRLNPHIRDYLSKKRL